MTPRSARRVHEMLTAAALLAAVLVPLAVVVWMALQR